MRLVGNLNNIKTKRDSKNADIEIYIDKVEYVTHRKDGKYFQPFDYEVELDEPILITGDRLAQHGNSQPSKNDFEFEVYDKEGDEYVLNPNKQLSLIIEYDFDLDLTIVSSLYYTETVSDEVFKELKRQGHKERVAKKGKRK